MKLPAALASACLVALTGLATSTAALADDDAKIEARIGAWGVGCKNRVAVTFPKSVMADINRSGLIFNWQYKKHNGYCETDGKGNITKFVKVN